MINGAVFAISFQPFSRQSCSEGVSFSLHEASNTSLDLGHGVHCDVASSKLDFLILLQVTLLSLGLSPTH